MPPSTTVLAAVCIPMVAAPSMAGASMRSTVPVVFPDATVQCPQSASTAGSKVTGDAGDPVTTACTMPPGPDPDQPLLVASSVGGPASSPHCGGSVTQPGPKPQKAAGDAVPPRSATSYPAGRSPRTRLIFAGLTWDCAADGALADGVESTPAWPHPATTDATASAIPRPNRRTPV